MEILIYALWGAATVFVVWMWLAGVIVRRLDARKRAMTVAMDDEEIAKQDPYLADLLDAQETVRRHS